MLVGPFEDTLFEMQTAMCSGPVRSDFGYHVIRLDELREGERPSRSRPSATSSPPSFARGVRSSEFYDRANELGDKAFDAYNELATVAAELQLPLKTLTGFPRTGDTAAFANSAAVVQAAFDEEVARQRQATAR